MPAFSPDEATITRFSFESGKHFANGQLKWRGFMPEDYQDRFELSTFWIDDLEDPAIWALAETRTPLARADFPASLCLDVGLGTEVDEAIDRHILVINWRDEKDLQKVTAMKLAALVSERGRCSLAV